MFQRIFIILHIYVAVVHCQACAEFSVGSSNYKAFVLVTHFTEYKTWNELKVLCDADYNLVSINTEEENNAILDILKENCTEGAYAIGLSREIGSDRTMPSSWNWESGETVEYLYWASGEPNVADGDCAFGYITTPGGRWSDLKCSDKLGNWQRSNGYGYICERSILSVDCGDLTNIIDGEVSLTGTTFGMTAIYTCTIGYNLIGDRSRVCLETEMWSGSTPFCEVIRCGDPGVPVDGLRYGMAETYNSVVSYICDIGYDLMGEHTITCQADGTWSNSAPNCQIVSCGDPGVPVDGLRYSMAETYNSVVSYICDIGYDLMGEHTITCQADGTWSNSAPNCQIVNCGNPGSPTNGERSVESETYGSIVQYKCNTGYDIMGSQNVTCLSNGTWSDSAPNCQIVDCMHPGSPDGITVELDKTTYGEIVTYRCSSGYFISSGNNWRICMVNGSWSGVEPKCSTDKNVNSTQSNNEPKNRFDYDSDFICDLKCGPCECCISNVIIQVSWSVCL